MKQYLEQFMTDFKYPGDAIDSLLKDYSSIFEKEEARCILETHVSDYEKNNTLDWQKAIESMDTAAKLVQINSYSAQFILFLCLTRHAHELYEKQSLPEQIFYDSFCDLRYKLMDCKQVRGVWGSFVCFWFPRFFELTRFALGRLQYETFEFDFDGEYKTKYKTLRNGDTVINMHIPSAGPLNHDSVIDSYKKAYSFYKNLYSDGIVPFVCDSWLLTPVHEKILPENSNILKFMKDFTIISSRQTDDFSDGWRVFGKSVTRDNISELPEETTLQRIYKNYLLGDGKAGAGYGVILFDGENILK